MHSAILLLFINFFKSAQPAILSRSNACKPLVTSPDWPSPESWRSLNDSVSGNLLAPFPPSIVCDSSKPQSFDLVACAQVGQSWYKSSFHRDDPVSVTYPNWQNDACLPTAVYNATIGCDLEPYPRYVVNATKASHIVETVNFAITTGVRLIVKGGAHDLLGRWVRKRMEIRRVVAVLAFGLTSYTQVYSTLVAFNMDALLPRHQLRPFFLANLLSGGIRGESCHSSIRTSHERNL